MHEPYWTRGGWYQGLNADDKRELEADLKVGQRTVERLAVVVQQLMREAELTKKPDYESAGWPYAAADSFGFNRACNKILALLTNREI